MRSSATPLEAHNQVRRTKDHQILLPQIETHYHYQHSQVVRWFLQVSLEWRWELQVIKLLMIILLCKPLSEVIRSGNIFQYLFFNSPCDKFNFVGCVIMVLFVEC